MTRNCYYDIKENKIFVSKSFMKKASTIGTTEYDILLNMQKDRPTATTEPIPTKKKENTYKGLDYNTMKEYVRDPCSEASLHEAPAVFSSGYLCAAYGHFLKWFYSVYHIFFDGAEI